MEKSAEFLIEIITLLLSATKMGSDKLFWDKCVSMCMIAEHIVHNLLDFQKNH
jgi:hypothetical protein